MAPAATGFDVVKTPHHGSANLDEGLMAAVRAPVGVVSVGEGNDYATCATATRGAAPHGYAVYRTDQRGDVALVERADGSVVVVTLAERPSPPPGSRGGAPWLDSLHGREDRAWRRRGWPGNTGTTKTSERTPARQVRFEATIHQGDQERALPWVADLDLDRVPDPHGDVRCSSAAEPGPAARRGLRGAPAQDVRAEPLSPDLRHGRRRAVRWLEERVQGIPREEGS